MPHNNPYIKLIQRGFIAHKNPQMISISSSKIAPRNYISPGNIFDHLRNSLILRSTCEGQWGARYLFSASRGKGKTLGTGHWMSVLGFLDGPMKPQTTPNNITRISTHKTHFCHWDDFSKTRDANTHMRRHVFTASSNTCIVRSSQQPIKIARLFKGQP